MCMATLQRRVQILFDPAQYALLEEEAARERSSVAAVVREAVDDRLKRRRGSKADALARLMKRAGENPVPMSDWATEKDDLDRESLRNIS